MSTPCTITAKYEDGTYHMIYCHFDGGLSMCGEKLIHHYSTLNKIKELLALGDLSWLGNTTRHKPEFWDIWSERAEEDYAEYCCTYRDRGEDSDASVYESHQEYLNEIQHHCQGVAVHYLFENGSWSFLVGDTFVQLTEDVIEHATSY